MVRWITTGKAKTIPSTLLLGLGGLAAFPISASAQTGPPEHPSDTVLGVTTTGLISLQPGDRTYVGWPYLDKPLGGVGPGFAVGLTLIERRGFAAAAEFGTARVQVPQSGRLVGGQATGRVHLSMLTGLAGYSASSRARTIVLLAGASRIIDSPSLDHVSIDQPYSAEGPRRLGLTAGIDISQAASRRVAFVGNIRYSNIRRNTQAIQIGVGQHVFRVGAGVRVRMK
jgi:hypothetical protein